MNKRKLGSLDFEISEITFGSASISSEGKGYSFGYISEDDAIALLREAHARGVNVFDTAPIYGHGVAEIRIGKAFKKLREKVFIVSKSGVTWDEDRRIVRTNDLAIAQKMMEQSLRDLQTDYIDLYMVHWPDPKIDIRKTLEVLRKAQDQGKIRHIGLCNTHVEDLEKAREVATIVATQSEFNLFNTKAREELFPYLGDNGVGFMSWGTLDRGIITGRVTKDRAFDEYDARGSAPWWRKEVVERKIQAMEEIGGILGSYTGLELALGFVLRHSELSSALCGVRNEEQLDSVLKACQKRPPDEVLDRAEEIAQTHLQT